MDRVEDEPRREDDAEEPEGGALAQLHAQAAEAEALADKLKRVEAEFVNETRRIRRKAEEERKYAIETVVVDLLPVVDALQKAREGLGDDEAATAIREGLALVGRQLDTVLERHGVTAIEARERPFDPARHQAMLVVEDPAREPGLVAEVLRTGYELNGRVVRPAEVVVTRAPASAAEVRGTPEPEAASREDEEND
jgi:molecular chaperone GrpE